MNQQRTTRPATTEEVAAYKSAVAPLIGNPTAVQALRMQMKLFVKSSGIYKKVH
jgi:hypothetical protein